MGNSGCCNRDVVSQSENTEETYITRYESFLGLSHHTVTSLIEGLFIITVNGVISEPRLKTFWEKFTETGKFFDQTDHPVRKFLDKFKAGTGFSPEKLSLLMTLLGTDEELYRADALFYCCDRDHNDFLSEEEVFHMLSDLVDISYVLLPTFAIDMLQSTVDSSQVIAIQTYMTLLSQAQSKVIAHWIDTLLENKANVTSAGFESVFVRECTPLCSAAGLRLFALKPEEEG